MLNFTGKVEHLSRNLGICPRLYHIIGVIFCNMYQTPALKVFRNVAVSMRHLKIVSFYNHARYCMAVFYLEVTMKVNANK